MSGEDILDPQAPPVPRNVELQRPRKITCEFCECELGSSGEYKKLSDKAKKYRDAEETIERMEAELATLRADLATARQSVSVAVVEPARLTPGIAL